MRVSSSFRYVWPSFEFELQVGENTIPELDALPEPIRRKLGFLIQRGVVQVLPDNDRLAAPVPDDGRAPDAPSGVQEIVREDGGPGGGVQTGKLTRSEPDAHAVGAGASSVDGTPSPGLDEDRAAEIMKVAGILANFSHALGHPIRAAIVLAFASGREFGFRELRHLLQNPRSTVSEHLGVLEGAGFVKRSRRRRYGRYRVELSTLEHLKWIIASLHGSPLATSERSTKDSSR